MTAEIAPGLIARNQATDEPDVSFDDLPIEQQLDMLYHSQVAIENKLDEILTVMKTIADAANNFSENIPPPLKAMLGIG